MILDQTISLIKIKLYIKINLNRIINRIINIIIINTILTILDKYNKYTYTLHHTTYYNHTIIIIQLTKLTNHIKTKIPTL